MSCASVYITPVALTCPTKADCEDKFRDELEDYIVQLTDLRDSIGSNLFQILSSRHIGDILFEAGCYPVFPSIRQGLMESGLDEVYQTGDIVKIVEQILRESDVVEDFVGIVDILTESVTIDECVKYIGSDGLLDRQKSNKALLGLGAHMGIFSEQNTWIIGKRDLTEQCQDGKHLKIKAKIVDIEWLEKERKIPLPVQLDNVFNFGTSFEQVRRGLDLIGNIQFMAPGVMCEAISCALIQKEFSEGREVKVEWLVGPEFENSISQLHVQNNPSVFRALVLACVNVICDVALDKTHPLRNGAGGNNPQIVAHGASAWRRDINYEFHLHYWTKGRCCEFASCVVHEDFTIPKPSLR